MGVLPIQELCGWIVTMQKLIGILSKVQLGNVLNELFGSFERQT